MQTNITTIKYAKRITKVPKKDTWWIINWRNDNNLYRFNYSLMRGTARGARKGGCLCYSFFYCFCHFLVIHSLNNFPSLVIVCVSILSLPIERYKSKDIPVLKRAIKTWTTSHKSLRQASFHHINIFFLDVFFGLQKPEGALDGVYHC